MNQTFFELEYRLYYRTGTKVKKILIGVLLVAIIAISWIVLSIDSIVKNNIEETGTYLAGVPVTIDSANISVFGGEGEIVGLLVKNPKGYTETNAFEMASIRFTIDLGSVITQPLIFTELILDSMVINLEILDDRRSNLQDIVNVSNKQNNVGKKDRKLTSVQESNSELTPQSGTDSDLEKTGIDENKKSSEKDDFRMVIDKLVFKDITFNALRGSDKWSDTIPNVTLKNLGNKKGIGSRELGIIIVRELTKIALEQAAMRTLSEILEEKAKEYGGKLLKLLQD